MQEPRNRLCRTGRPRGCRILHLYDDRGRRDGRLRWSEPVL